MKLAKFLAGGSEQPRNGTVEDGRVRALADDVDIVDVLAGANAREGRESWALSEVTLLAPVPDPGDGVRDRHELRLARRRAGQRDAPRPIVFDEGPDRGRTAGRPRPLPEVVHELDYEGELIDRDRRSRTDRRLLRRRRRHGA